jgi:hypothetical protein
MKLLVLINDYKWKTIQTTIHLIVKEDISFQNDRSTSQLVCVIKEQESLQLGAFFLYKQEMTRRTR